MNTKYEEWARYDVEKELEHVDTLEHQEQIKRQREQKVEEKRNMEDSITRDAEQTAEVLAAQAAVAALRAKSRGRGRGRMSIPTESTCKSNPSAHAPASTGMLSSERLQQLAELVREKHSLIKSTMESRRRGDDLVKTQQDLNGAMAAYQSALDSAKALEALIPRLSELEGEGAGLGHVDQHKDEGCTKDCKHGNNCRDGHHPRTEDRHDHQNEGEICKCGASSGLDKGKKSKVDEKLPRANDLPAVVAMFLKDCYVGIGTCEMERGRHARAADAYKEVLLRDEHHLLVWLRRGLAFEAMDAPLLAWLHYNRVTSQDSEFEDAKACEERIKKMLLEESTQVHPAAHGAETLVDALRRAQVLMEAGNCIMIEGFHEYAVAKFTSALMCLENSRRYAKVDPAIEVVVQKLEFSCHLNIASASLEMQRNLAVGASHCQDALKIIPHHAVAKFRLAQIYQATHAYSDALREYDTVRSAIGPNPKHSKKLHDAIDKCQFDRCQYDAPYIHQLMESAGHST